MLLIWVLIEPNGISISMKALRLLFPCYWCHRAICTNVGTDCSCQDKCQSEPPCPSPSLWSWVYCARLWKDPCKMPFLQQCIGTLGKVWFPDRKANVECETGCWCLFPWRFGQLTGVCCKETSPFFFFLLTIYLIIPTFYLLLHKLTPDFMSKWAIVE